MKQYNLSQEDIDQFLKAELKIDLSEFPLGIVTRLAHYRRQARRFKAAIDHALKTGKDVEVQKDATTLASFKQRIGEALSLLCLLSPSYRVLRESVQLCFHENRESIVIKFKNWAISTDFKQAVGDLIVKGSTKTKEEKSDVLDEVKAFLSSTDSVKQWKFVTSAEIESIKRMLDGTPNIELNIGNNTVTIAKYD